MCSDDSDQMRFIGRMVDQFENNYELGQQVDKAFTDLQHQKIQILEVIYWKNKHF